VGAFEHFEEGLGPCLREAHRVLKLRGSLYVTVPFQNWRHTVLGIKGDGCGEPFLKPKRFYQGRLTRHELADELRLYGFRALETNP
jgi:predicted SAM-dependent methyltransferase